MSSKKSKRSSKKDGPSKWEEYSEAYKAGDPNAGFKPKPQKEYPEGVDPEYQTLSGWMFFVFLLWVSTAIMLGARYITVLRYTGVYMQVGLGVFAIVYDIGMLAAIVPLVASIFMMWRRKQKFLFFFQISQFIEIGVSLLLIIVLGVSVSGSIGYSDIMSMAASLVLSVLTLFACTAYLCKSVRVRSYMRSTDFIDEAVFRFLD